MLFLWSRRRQHYQVFLLAEGRRFDVKKCQIVPKNATRLYIENRTFGDQITSPAVLSKWKTIYGGDGIFRAKLKFCIENKSPKVSHFEELLHWMSCLNYSKELWTNEVTYSHLSNFMLWACVVLAFPNFWFITIWQFLNVFWRIISSIIISNQNGSKILTKCNLCKVWPYGLQQHKKF